MVDEIALESEDAVRALERERLRMRLQVMVGASASTIANVRSGHFPREVLDRAGLADVVGGVSDMWPPGEALYQLHAVQVHLVDRLHAGWAATVRNDRRSITLAGTLAVDSSGHWRITEVVPGPTTELRKTPERQLEATRAAQEARL